MSKIVIKTKELSRQLSGEVPVTLVKDINLEVREGEFLVISGLQVLANRHCFIC